jgi:hypothetical protein
LSGIFGWLFGGGATPPSIDDIKAAVGECLVHHEAGVQMGMLMAQLEELTITIPYLADTAEQITRMVNVDQRLNEVIHLAALFLARGGNKWGEPEGHMYHVWRLASALRFLVLQLRVQQGGCRPDIVRDFKAARFREGSTYLKPYLAFRREAMDHSCPSTLPSIYTLLFNFVCRTVPVRASAWSQHLQSHVHSFDPGHCHISICVQVLKNLNWPAY